MNSVAVIDYGMGNLHSVASALAHIAPDANVQVTHDSAVIAAADRVIFPGVGAIRDCMGEIRRLGIDTLLKSQLDAGKPVLAICVGMQALLASSEENGGVDCLAMLPGVVKGFNQDVLFQQANLNKIASERLKVPHMGWNQVAQRQSHPLWENIADHSRFYFVHSFFVQTPNAEFVAGNCHHGIDFVAALACKNLFAVQFHPEKSHEAGLQLLRNFMQWNGRV